MEEKRSYRPPSGIGIDDIYLSDSSISALNGVSSSENLKSDVVINDDNVIAKEEEKIVHSQTSSTWEIIGLLKSKPEDFVVREISLDGNIAGITSTFSLTEEEDLSKVVGIITDDKNNNSPQKDAHKSSVIYSNTTEATINNESIVEKESSRSVVSQPENPSKKPKLSSDSKDAPDGEQQKKKETTSATKTPLKNMESYLEDCCCSYNAKEKRTINLDENDKNTTYILLDSNVDSHLEMFDSLSKSAKEKLMLINKGSAHEINDDHSNKDQIMMMIPPPKSLSTQDRGEFHKAIRILHPFLQSITLTKAESMEMFKNFGLSLKEGDDEENNDSRWIKVLVDSYFFDIAPYLNAKYAIDDLSALYKFRNEGVVLPPNGFSFSNNNRSKRNNKNNKRKREEHKDNQSQQNNNTDGQSLLHIYSKVDNKDDRRKLHVLLSSKCKDFETFTINSNGPKERNSGTSLNIEDDCQQTTTIIGVKWSKGAVRKMLKKKQRKKNTKDGNHNTTNNNNRNSNEYVTRCILRKYNTEHLDCLNKISKTLNNKRQSDISVAGIKDYMAITYQYITFRNTSIKTIQHKFNQSHNGNIEGETTPYITFGNFVKLGLFNIATADTITTTSSTNMLNKGDLLGNHFDITLRNLEIQESTSKTTPIYSKMLDHLVSDLNTYGFINFYGEQRVGEAGPSDKVGKRSYEIGRAILQKQYSKAIDLLMHGRNLTKRKRTRRSLTDDTNKEEKEQEWYEIESPLVQEARQIWFSSEKDPSKVLKFLERNKKHIPSSCMTRERIVLDGLNRYGTDNPLLAIKCIHYNDRSFWINAYQSYVWNLCASERMKRYGRATVIEGDLYFINEGDAINNNNTSKCKKRKNIKEVFIATSQDIQQNRVHISQVILPLVGYNTIYPKNDVGEYMKNILQEDQVEFINPSEEEGGGGGKAGNNKHKRDSTAKGSYRTLISFPRNVTWKKVNDDDDECRVSNSNEKENEKNNDVDLVKNACFSFELDSGSYATMMLRELLKQRLNNVV